MHEAGSLTAPWCSERARVQLTLKRHAPAYLPFANGTLGPHRRTHTQGSLQHQRVSERAHLAKTPPRLYSLNLKCIIFSFPSVHIEQTHKSTIICL